MAADKGDILSALDSRTFIQENGPSGANAAEYFGCARMGGVTIPLGDVEKIFCPSPTQYRAYIPVDSRVSRPGTPTTELVAWMQKRGVDRQAKMARAACPFALYQNFGDCSRPDNWDEFQKTLVISGAQFTELAYSQLGVLNDDDEQVMLTTPISFEDAYQVVPINLSERAGSLITVRVVDVAICDAPSCGECADPSGGCEDIFAITLGVGGSPGNSPELIYSLDKGSTWTERSITTYNGSEGTDAIGCVGQDTILVLSDLGGSHSYADKDDLSTWTEVSGGYVAGRGPRALWVKSEREIFVSARAGYIYKITDVTAAVTVKEAGVLTVSNLVSIHGVGNTIVAVGTSNALLLSRNGGESWSLVVGPAVAVNLNAVWVKTTQEWWVGTGNGRLYYTLDGGTTWVEKAFTGSGAGAVRDIAFVTPEVGYMTHDTAAPVARLFRTRDGGHTWRNTASYLTGTPVADVFQAIGVCHDPNFVVVGGLADNATDGILAIGE